MYELLMDGKQKSSEYRDMSGAGLRLWKIS